MSIGSRGCAFSLKALALAPSLSCERTMTAPSVCRRGSEEREASITSWVVYECCSGQSNGETCYKFTAYTICGVVRRRHGLDRRVCSQYTFKAATADAKCT